MGRNSGDETLGNPDYIDESQELLEEEEEEEEALSLCDLPINEENQIKACHSHQPIETQEEFDFCSLLKESQMCAADEVFFQGQILPLRQSISSESRSISRSISRSESMDHFYSSAGYTCSSSRSSSIRSHNSYSSGSTSSTATPLPNYKPKIRNQFHSHPSPSPQLRFSTSRHSNACNSNRKSTLWSLFRVGLVTTPEIAFHDLKVRNHVSNSNKGFGSRNSTSSSSSNFSTNGSTDKKKKKNKRNYIDKKGSFFGGGNCRCSVSAVETVPSPKVVTIIRRSASLNEEHFHSEEIETKEAAGKALLKTKIKQQQTGKQALSRHRTFEWLKQLSLEAAAEGA